MRLTPLVSSLLLLSAPAISVPASSAHAQGTQTGSTQQPAQGVAVRRGPVSSASADTLVECVPISRPTKTTPAAAPVRRRRPRPRPRPAAVAGTPKPAPKPVPKPKAAVTPHPVRKHVVRRPRRPVAAVASNAPRRGNLPALVMCRPIHPVAPASMGPLPETMVPIPQVASAAPVAAAPLPVEEVPSYIVAAGPHSRFLPLALIPAFFIPFIHGGHHTNSPIDTTTPPPVIPPPPPPVGPPTTVPEPSSVAMLGTGLLALGGIGATRRSRKSRQSKRSTR